MEFQKLIKERFSVRSFRPEHLSDEQIRIILDAAHVAPTGCNKQPQRILVLNTDASLEKLKSCTKCHFNAPTAFLICYNVEETWKRPYDGALSAPVDAVIVTTHMMLAAHDIGVGSCWVMHFDPVAMRKTFHIPDGIEPSALLVMGIPAEDAEPSIMHTQTRPMDEVVFYDSF